MSEHVHYLKPPKMKRSKGRARPDDPLADWCEIGVRGVCTGRAQVRHHIVMRSGLGGDEKANTLDLCDACHRFAHANRNEARERGWIVAA